MVSYAAFLRGIMPMNPNTRNAKLKEVFEGLGFSDVQTVISSGNVVFKSKPHNADLLENKIEKALALSLDFKNPVIVRSKDELERIIRKNPFKGKEHDRKSYLIVTFLKKEPREIFSTLDLTKAPTPSFMTDLEKTHGKMITTRTWLTINRIMKKF